MNDPIRDIFFDIVCHDLGIVPIKDISHDVNRILANIDPVEARKMKRKFRKLWRKCAFKEAGHFTFYKASKSDIEKRKKNLGLGQEKPSREIRRRRKLDVSYIIVRKEMIMHMKKLDSGQAGTS